MGLNPQVMSETVKNVGLKAITARHRELARLVAMGMAPVQIATEMGITQTWLSIIMNSPLFKLEVYKFEERRNNTVEELKEDLLTMASGAIRQMGKTLYTSPSEKLRMDAAKDILDRAGVEKKSTVNVVHDVVEHPVDLDKYRTDKSCSDHEQPLDITNECTVKDASSE